MSERSRTAVAVGLPVALAIGLCAHGLRADFFYDYGFAYQSHGFVPEAQASYDHGFAAGVFRPGAMPRLVTASAPLPDVSRTG